MANENLLIWDEERVGLKDGCVLFMAFDEQNRVDVAGAVDAEMLRDLAPALDPYDPVTAFRAVAPGLRRAVAGAYKIGAFEEVWDAPGVLRHRRVFVRIGSA
ncbi:hypothetical protein ACFQ1E_08405 [Sphingomonas canadensis]|uniref:Uncharacterized protein n=1 Tax=Sphingomonas canadensis TaxID=1219257 RepID=A0ABW3H4G3_9SPHN|nr:hypothetical protein [Sphingomonas canadensis]